MTLYLAPLMLATMGLACQAQPAVVSDTVDLDTMIGQMILVGFRGTEVDKDHPIHDDIVTRKVGGVILFEYDVLTKSRPRNISSFEQVKHLVSTVQDWSDQPLFVAIDQEGGRVDRLKARYGFPESVSAAYLGHLDNEDSTRSHAARTASLLSSLGLNVNFAPVVDVDVNADNPIIGGIERSLGEDDTLVSRHAGYIIEEHRREGVISVLKHFPGHGSSKGDTHLGLVDVTDTWEDRELNPYRSLIDRGLADGVMTAHVVHKGLDSAGTSSTLSPLVIDGLLRERLGYDGVVFSDDLQMGAIRDHYTLNEIVALAIHAGVDVMTFGNNVAYEPDIASRVIEIVHRLIETGEVTQERIEVSYRRIMRLKNAHL